ncbi:MAG TPA: branched-chain amino acid ABC transporter permease [Gammaproteobacteria bacterium]|nr:branched-chain amino acid ABC transporter permease [Gammaproteobacteria bacterium]
MSRLSPRAWYGRCRQLLAGHPHYALLLVVTLPALLAMPGSTWVTLTVAGLGMGTMLFVMASGMTLTFGLMSVLNLGHGALITVGAFIGATLVTGLATGHWPLPALSSLVTATGGPWLWRIGALSLGLLAAAVLHAGVFRLAGERAQGERAAAAAGSSAAGLAALATQALVAGTWASAGTALAVGVAAGLAVAAAMRGRQAGSGLAWPVPGLVAPPLAIALLAWLRPAHAFTADFGLMVPAFLAAIVLVAAVGYVFERLIIRPVYGNHLKQIMVTVGAAIIIGEIVQAIWGPGQVPMSRPDTLQGGISLGTVSIESYRLFAGLMGLLVYWGLQRLIRGTRLGLLIRAGVEDREMVQALGYRIEALFIAVFVGGAALAGLGGVMWGLYQSFVTVSLGPEMLVLIIIVIIIGGLGSITGCFYAALVVGLLNNYTIYLFPKVALFSSIGLMVLVLLWRPQGLIPTMR